MRSLRKLMSNGTIAHNSVIWKRSGDELDSLIDRVDSLIFNLLALTTTFDTSKEINQQVVALESVLKEIEPAIMRYVRKKGIIFKKNVEEDVLILGSSEYLQAICRNILENAIKYSPKGGFVLLNVEIQKESILISIHDAGDGFAPHVLSAFEQDKWGVTTMGTQGEKGAGIGLYATKRFIQAQRGNICIKQNEPIGTIVEITIPRALKPITRSVI
jgi:K+-sensing histidine kinase KdpD